MKTIKERAMQLLKSQTDEETVYDAFALLQEIAHAPEPEPVGEAVNFNGWVIINWKCKESDFQVGTKFYAIPPAKNQSEHHLEMVNQPAPSVPVLTVECEPDYWGGGHYHEGTMPYIDPTAVWKLPIGTKLYTAPPAQSVPDAELVRDAERLRTAHRLLTMNAIGYDEWIAAVDKMTAIERDKKGGA